MLEDAVRNVGPEFLVVGIGQLVVNDLGQDVIFLGQPRQLVDLDEGEDRRLLDQDVLAGFQGGAGWLKMSVVGGGNAAPLADRWLQPVSDDPQDRLDGFGLATWGTWGNANGRNG